MLNNYNKQKYSNKAKKAICSFTSTKPNLDSLRVIITPTIEFKNLSNFEQLMILASFNEANKSISKKKKVGAILTIDNIQSYNGHNQMFNKNELCENSENKTNPFVIHAEEIAIINYLKEKENNFFHENNENILTMFCTYAPCHNCAKLIKHANIQKVYFIENHKYDFDLGENAVGLFFEKHNIKFYNVINIPKL